MVALHMLRSSGVKSSRPAVVLGWVTARLKRLGLRSSIHMLHRSGVKSSRPAVGIGWVTTRCRPRIAPRLGMAGSGRRFAPRRPVCLLLAGYCPWVVSPPDGGGLAADPSRGDEIST